MCTTFLAYKIVDSLYNLKGQEKVEFLDFPRLVRFNPNIPWKTRGNGAVSFRVKTTHPLQIKDLITDMVSQYSETDNGANPGLAFFEGDLLSPKFAEFSRLALWQLIKRDNAKKFAKNNNLTIHYHGNGQGLVGAIGAIGYTFDDHTLELLSYRKRSKFGTLRKITSDSVKQMQDTTYPHTFNSYDPQSQKVLITPHGPDPVFYGIRGEDAGTLIRASKLLKIHEELDGYMIFKSNQGTGDHLKNVLNPDNMQPYASGTISGTVSGAPQITRGGHVFFTVVSGGHEFRCAVYKPTGMTGIALKLINGDGVSVGGGVRKASKNHSRVINLEFLDVLSLSKDTVISNPICTKCSKNMKSKGVDQGFQCIRCGSTAQTKLPVIIPRKLKKQLYLPKLSAHRHLSRPLQRIGITNKTVAPFDETAPWFHTFN